MPSCCYHDDYGAVFTPAEAAATKRRFLERGVAGTGARVVELLEARGAVGGVVLEVGAGVGDVLVTLVERGAEGAIDVDLSPPWVEAARSLFAERGLAERLDARVGDFVDEAESLPRADAVILNRVVCCYPNWRAMLDAAAGRSRRLLVLVYPPDDWPHRVVLAFANLWYRLRRLRFRVYVHPEEAMIERLAAAGFGVVERRADLVWRYLLVRREAGESVPDASTASATD